MKFAEGFHAKIEVPAGAADVQVFDDELPGFGCRKFASGACSFFVKYNVGKQQRRKSLGAVVKGNLKAMRLEASGILAKARLGQDVVAEARETSKPLTTLGGLVPIYLKARETELREKSHREATRYLTKTWAPLHDRPIDGITRRDIVAVLDTLEAKVAADRARTSLSAFYSWAIDRSHVDASPVLNIRSRAKNGGRERVLSEAELAQVWKAADQGTDYGRIVRLLILTGQRRAEIGDLAWSEIDLEKRQIELPPARTKNKRPHIVPLCDGALEILATVERGTSDHLFGRCGGGFTGWDAGKQALDERIAAGASNVPLPAWVVHDLRRSLVTHLGEELGVQPHVVEAIVNHVSGAKAGVAGIYNKALYLAERRQALDLWGNRVSDLGSGTPIKVVPMRKRA